MSITLGEEKEKVYCEFQVDIEEDTMEQLLTYARERILEDNEELINYAVVRILKEQLSREKAKETPESNEDS